MRVLVSGGAGFIGSNLVDRLVADGHDVVVVDDLSRGSRDNLGLALQANAHDFFDVQVVERQPAGRFTVLATYARTIADRYRMYAIGREDWSLSNEPTRFLLPNPDAVNVRNASLSLPLAAIPAARPPLAMTAEISKSTAAAPSTTLKVRVAPCRERLPAMAACALFALAVTAPFRARLPIPVVTFPPFTVSDPTVPAKPFKSSRPELLMVTAVEAASC